MAVRLVIQLERVKAILSAVANLQTIGYNLPEQCSDQAAPQILAVQIAFIGKTEISAWTEIFAKAKCYC